MNPRALAGVAAARVRRSGPFQRARKALTLVLPYRKMPGGPELVDAQYASGTPLRSTVLAKMAAAWSPIAPGSRPATLETA